MSVVDDYLATQSGREQTILAHMYDIVRQLVPEATEELSYALPAFKYKGKGLVAIVTNKNFLSLYPFSSIDKLGIDLSAFEQTSGSIHFTPDKPIPDDLFTTIIQTRQRHIES